MAVGQLTTRMRESVKRLSIIKKPSVSFMSFRSSVKEDEEGADEENGNIPQGCDPTPQCSPHSCILHVLYQKDSRDSTCSSSLLKLK